MEICTMLYANFISNHPYITCGVLLYALVIAWVVYQMKIAPTVDDNEKIIQHKGDEIDITLEDLMNMR